MFTGIIEEIGRVKEIINTAHSTHIVIIIENEHITMKKGDSISVNGVCLTVTHHSYGSFEADISPETLEKSNLNQLKAGDTCNIESAIRAGEPFGGHFVTGHIDGMGKILTNTKKGNSHLIKISAPDKLMKYIVSKGSVAIDGISLTPFNCTDNNFDISIIPHTHAITTLKEIKPGAIVNIECDILSKYIERLIDFKSLATEEKKGSKIDKDYLKKTGFLI